MTVPNESGSGHRLLWTGVLVVVIAAIVIALLSRAKTRGLAAEGAQRVTTVNAGPIVRTIKVVAASGMRDVTVQGEAQPWASVTLYAKVSGYLKSITVDKGDAVKQGQGLGEIESPETDQAFLAAQADASAKRELARRDKELLDKHFVAAEEYESAEAAAKIADARVQGLGTERGYEHLVAPFDGTVTARFADPGALVQNAMNSQTSALPVVTIADVSHLRVRVFLDQQTASLAKRGVPVEIRLPERPGFALHATISRLTEQLDPKTRTLLAEIDVDNRSHQLLAGSFVEVRLRLPAPAAVTVPAEAVITKGDRQLVAVVDSTNHIRLRPVTLGESDGTRVDILHGLAVGERIAVNLGPGTLEGSIVRPDSTGGAIQ